MEYEITTGAMIFYMNLLKEVGENQAPIWSAIFFADLLVPLVVAYASVSVKNQSYDRTLAIALYDLRVGF